MVDKELPDTNGQERPEPTIRLEPIDLEKRRADQLGVNCSFLISITDEICHIVSPKFIGTWQDRAKEALRAVRESNKNG